MRKKTRIRWNTELSPAANARAALPDLAKEYFKLSQKAGREKATEADLHAFRLATKRFRYTLEMFVPLYGAGLEARIKRIRRVQQALGEIQDCESVRNLATVKKNRSLMLWLRRRLESKRAAFRKIWQIEFGKPEAGKSWISFLERYARDGRISSGTS
jgi:CHAD domain-containing protein